MKGYITFYYSDCETLRFEYKNKKYRNYLISINLGAKYYKINPILPKLSARQIKLVKRKSMIAV